MNKGRQKKTTLKYLLYLYVLCKQQNIVVKDYINIKNIKLMKLFHISTTDSDFHEHLEELGILECVDDYYYFDYSAHYGIKKSGNKVETESVTKKYSINVDKYIEELSDKIGLFPEVYKKLCSEETFISELQDIEDRFRYWIFYHFDCDSPTFNIRKVEYHRAFLDFVKEPIVEVMTRDSCAFTYDLYAEYYKKPIDYLEDTPLHLRNVFRQFIEVNPKPTEYDKHFAKELWIREPNVNDFVKDDWDYIRNMYLQYIFETSVLKNLAIAQEQLLRKNYEIRLKAKIKITKGNKGFFIHNTGRQNNPLCKMIKEERKAKLSEEGFDSNFDLHSAIYAVARLMNFGVFDPDWDIKRELLENHTYKLVDGSDLTKDQLKKVLYRTFFEKTLADSLNKYKNACLGRVFTKSGHLKRLTEKQEEQLKELPIMSDETFTQLFNDCQTIIGGSTDYYYTVFYIESLIECNVILKMLEKRYDVKNVYDCFYFKSSQTTENEVKQMIKESALETYHDLHPKSIWWD